MSLVEYFDPDGLFPVLAPQLEAHLPLRNLHWASASRPVRSIDSLHVEFIANQKQSPESVNAGASGDGVSRRRHQLPGLRPTPYLKVYLLRCDDKDVYKSSKRDLLQEWLRTNTNANQSGSISKRQDNHDAFEWLILHVVLPNTIAATQPALSKPTGTEPDGTKDKTSSNSRWPGRGSSTILEKLRKDFNQSSKTAPDHVAQIRLQKDQTPPHMLPALPPPSATVKQDSAKDRELAWSDLVGKLKSLILTSFNLRVSQYEEDVREKETQRTLPGWNFCTFFVLKEGLARAFESVGLIEDALVGYDELSAGLDTALEDGLATGADRQSNKFLPFTPEFHDLLVSLKETSEEGVPEQQASILLNPLSAAKKPYRDLIASNNISAFDFRCYIAARQLALMLRLARPAKPLLTASNSSTHGGPTENVLSDPAKFLEDPSLLANVCQSGLAAILSLTRLLRQDLWASMSDLNASNFANAIDAVSAAWTYDSVTQLLADTTTVHLPDTSSLLEKHASHIPVRTSIVRGSSFASSVRENETPDQWPFAKEIPVLNNAGLIKVAACRAELCMLQRRILERVAAWYGWQLSGIASGVECRSRALETADNGHESPNNSQKPVTGQASTLLSKLAKTPLSEVLVSEEKARDTYQILTRKAAWLYKVANRHKSAERLLADLAISKFVDGDYALAATYCTHLASGYSQTWRDLEWSFLKIYAICMKKLNRKDEYIRVAVLLSEKRAISSGQPPQGSQSGRVKTDSWTATIKPLIADPDAESEDVFADLPKYSLQLSYDIPIKLERHFADLDVDDKITLYEDRDGFKIGMRVRQLLSQKVTADVIQAKLVSVGQIGHPKEILLESDRDIAMDSGLSQVSLSTNTTTLGSFILEKVTIRMGKLVFAHNYLTSDESTTPLGLMMSENARKIEEVKGTPILCYPRPDSFQASLNAAPWLHIGRARNLELTLRPGDNDIKEAEVILKSGSAGLRLRTAEAKGDLQLRSPGVPGIIKTEGIQPGGTAKILIPYDLEHELPTLNIKIEVKYTVDRGSFVWTSNAVINIELDVDVSVQDVFKENTVFSRFSLKPVQMTPVRLLNVDFQGSKDFSVEACLPVLEPFTILPQDPTCITYKITGDTSSAQDVDPGLVQRRLLLTLDYYPVGQDILDCSQALLAKELKESPFWSLRYYLCDILEQSLKKHRETAGYETATIPFEYALPSFEESSWQAAMIPLSKEIRDDLLKWLEHWHQQHPTIELDASAAPPEPRRLMIDFEVPQLNYLHTASLGHVTPELSESFAIPVIATGEAISATLNIRFTRRWDFSRPRMAKDEPVELTYELMVDPENWIVAGHCRNVFTARPEEQASFEITLVPLRPGYCLLPAVEVTLAGPEAASMSSDTDCLSISQGIWVVAGMKSTTVGVGSGDSMTGALEILESR